MITSDRAKLPGEVAALLDPAMPLPADVVFIEKRYEITEMLRNFLIACGLALAALIVIPFGVAMLFDRTPVTVNSHVDYYPLGFGLVLALGAWMMFLSINTCWQLRALQRCGQCTRRGTFLTLQAFVQVSENDTTIIPPPCFAGLKENTICYLHNSVVKTFSLPAQLVNATPQQLHHAIMHWMSKHPEKGSHPELVALSKARR